MFDSNHQTPMMSYDSKAGYQMLCFAGHHSKGMDYFLTSSNNLPACCSCDILGSAAIII